MKPGTVYFIGAGPGDPDLITVKGQRIIQQADLVLYAGSLVPKAIVEQAKPDAQVVDSSPLSLPETHALLKETCQSGGIAARVHTGDPALYGAVREQAMLLDEDGIAYETIPGVTSAFAAAAAADISFTAPERTQSLVFTRLHGRTPVPEKERLRNIAALGCSIAIYLSAGNPEGVRDELLAGGMSEETPVLIARKIGWPGESFHETTIGKMVECACANEITRQALFLVLPAEAGDRHESRLYAPEFAHGYRKS